MNKSLAVSATHTGDRMQTGRNTAPAWQLALVTAVCMSSGAGVHAAGGTAKPPGGGGGGGGATLLTPVFVATVPPPPAIGKVTLTNARNTSGFDITGFIQKATVDGTDCPNLPADQFGGSAIVNGITIKIPCNTILQMPANTLHWADAFSAADLMDPNKAQAPLLLGGTRYLTTEMHVVGNIVNGTHIAGLVYVSQQSTNSGTGHITHIDYNTGAIYVGNIVRDPKTNQVTSHTDLVRLVINDPFGRFGRAQSPDARFSVDDANPTIKSAGSGYPMCVPRVLSDPTINGGPDDPLCPQKNRPKVPTCRNFSNAGVISPAGWELGLPAVGQIYCSAFVMKAPPGTTTDVNGTNLATTNIATAADPDAREQAPFEVDDFISYSGTLLYDDALGPNGTNTISVHTIDANVGIYTQPRTLPVYMAIGEFGVGADAPLTAANGAPQETTNRLVLEAVVSDVTSVVDIYEVDINPVTGATSQRWITPETMTGGVTPGSQPFGGGITTQFIGPQPGRARIRATKAPTGILTSPTRNIRVTVRSLCAPGTTAYRDPATGVTSSYIDINTAAKPLALDTADVAAGRVPAQPKDGAGTVPCLERARAANGLFTGQYMAPTFEYIFPENVVTGDAPVPANFWDLGFLVNGEATGIRNSALIPSPW
jgi:hypothetical protein